MVVCSASGDSDMVSVLKGWVGEVEAHSAAVLIEGISGMSGGIQMSILSREKKGNWRHLVVVSISRTCSVGLRLHELLQDHHLMRHEVG